MEAAALFSRSFLVWYLVGTLLSKHVSVHVSIASPGIHQFMQDTVVCSELSMVGWDSVAYNIQSINLLGVIFHTRIKEFFP
jgi:hypothetical protein